MLWGPVLAVSLFSAESPDLDLKAMRSALIPKREVEADAFLRDHPTYDGRGVVMAVFDTGVDPAAAGLAVTSTGVRKLVDILDASGSGDVDTSTLVEPDGDGALPGLSGISLRLPAGVVNPAGKYRLGLKSAEELFPKAALARLTKALSEQRQAEINRLRAERERLDRKQLEEAKKKAPGDRNRAERDLVARDEGLAQLENEYVAASTGPGYDCVVWHDGSTWRVIVDTDRDGDLADEPQLRPFGVAGEYGTFDQHTNASFGVQVYEEGDLLSIVTTSGTHGSHVASIAAANFPDDPERNGIAPGARVLSIKIGDVRSGGSSYGISERRALALAATYGVDLINASWGGGSVFQDGADSNAHVYQTLVDRYDILAVLSAGNEGPALSTNGSAGGEASRVLGVGAYSSAEMATTLYNALKDSPNAALQFSSRGPTKDGDVGVDVMAPGAAWASYSAESLTSAEMINGTSMAAPSAAGVAALVLSAAKQQQLKHDPARVRSALILGARPIPEEEVFTSGQGLVSARGAWAKLQVLQDAPEFQAFYDLEVTGGTYFDVGRGLYLRESAPSPRQRATVTITPRWPESVTADARFKFETDLEFVPAASWIEVPSYAHLANGDQRVTLFMDLPALSEAERQTGGVVTSKVDAFVAGKRNLGPLFTIPITVVRPADQSLFVDHKRHTKIELSPAETKRLFLQVPERADRLQVKLKHTAKDPVARRFFIQALTPAAHSWQGRFKTETVPWLEEGEETTLNIPVKGGGVTEIAFNQYFYSFGPATLEVELEWWGIGLGRNSLTMEPNQGWLPVELNPLATKKVKVEAKLEHGLTVHLPKTATEFFDDERSVMPASPLTAGPSQSPLMRLTYEIELKESLSAALTDLQNFDGSERLGGGLVRAIHESGEVLYVGFPNRKKPIKFPKGKTTIVSDYSSSFDGALAVTKSFALVLAAPLKPAPSLGISGDLRAAFEGKNTDDVALHEGREHIIFLRDTVIDELAKTDPMPDYFAGYLKFEDQAEHELAKEALAYFPGKSPAKVTNQDAKAKPAKDLKSEPEKLSDAWVELQLKFLRDHRSKTDPAIVTKRREILSELRQSRPDDPAPIVEQAIDLAMARQLTSPFWGETKSKDEATDEAVAEEKTPVATSTVAAAASPDGTEVIALLDEAQALIDTATVAAFFGAKPVALPGDLARRDEIEADSKRHEVSRGSLAKIARLRADVLRSASSMDAAWQAFVDVSRWEDKPSDDTLALEAELLRASQLWGLALNALNRRIEKAPYDSTLLQQRVELYRELGWETFAVEQARQLAQRAHTKKLLTAR